MPFNRNDIYTSSGSVKLYNSWTPYVSKYDTSSFYNWEQDNLPLYDLEERTYELWEQAGFATSAGVPGLALTVSADAPASVLAANRNVFTSVSACIAAIPKIVRFPVLVEVGNFGDLGKLELHNFRIEENGSIEIINRGFGRIIGASSLSTGIANVQTPTYNNYNRLIGGFTSQDLSSSLYDSSCINIATRVFSSVGDQRLNTGSNAIFANEHTFRTGVINACINRDLTSDTPNIFCPSSSPEEVGFADDNTLGTFDISATRQSTNAFFGASLRRQEGSTARCTGNFYTNTVSKISVKNCDGPIYIRNFFVNGNASRSVGIEIVNSDVVLENCTAVRCKEAGFKFNNSKVILSRSAYAYRNYALASTTTRVPETGYGFHFINSDVTLSSLPISVTSTSVGDTGASSCDAAFKSSRNYAGFVLENSKLIGGISRTITTQASSASVLGSELNTGFGLILNNSIVNVLGLVDVFSNDTGILSDNSNVRFEELCVDLHTNEGIISRNSTFLWDYNAYPTNTGQFYRSQIEFAKNSQHLVLNNNSYFGFQIKNSIPQNYGNTLFDDNHGVIRWSGAAKANLPAISVDNGSTFEGLNTQIRTDATPDAIQFAPNYGRALKASNSSKASFYGTKNGCTFIFGTSGYDYQKTSAGLYATNNSTINLHGPTAIAQYGVDVLVDNNSILNIEPTRARSGFGLEVSGFDLSSGENHTAVELHATRACLVANKNSTINLLDLGAFPSNWGRGALGSQYLSNGIDYPVNTYDISSYISSGCLQFYPNPQDSNAITSNKLDDLVNAGGLGFTVPSYPKFTLGTGLLQLFVTDNPINSAATFSTRSKITQGGVCIRATEDSIVNVRNVHFPIGTNGSPLDGFYYTTSGSDCDKLMIWNIADTSRLNASYLSVSGLHPADTIYHGPSAFWVSSQTGTGAAYVPASGAPAGTPDTGPISVLDLYGAGSSIWIIPSGVTLNSPFNRFYLPTGSETTAQRRIVSQAGINYSGTTKYLIGAGPDESLNQGVFRIYWSPKASARVLQTDLSGFYKGAYPYAGGPISGVVGPAYQIFAQGYNCSAPLSALVPTGETNASSLFPDLLKLSFDSNNDGINDQMWTSGFYYCSEMLQENPTQCLLDESAAKTFANAQNASVGLAGRPKKVTIYRSRSDSGSNRDSESYTGDASGSLGFKSALIFDLSRDN